MELSNVKKERRSPHECNKNKHDTNNPGKKNHVSQNQFMTKKLQTQKSGQKRTLFLIVNDECSVINY